MHFHRFPRAARCALALGWLGLAAAAMAADLSAEERLEAVRQELVRATLEGATQVQSTAWVDASGALRESSSFRQGMQVRGVRVLAYQRDADGQARAQVQWQGKEDTVKAKAASAGSPAAAPACAADGRLRHVLGLAVSLHGPWSEQEAYLAEDARLMLGQAWSGAAEASPHWRLMNLPVNLPSHRLQASLAVSSSAAYERLLTGAPPVALPAWVAALRLEPLPPVATWTDKLRWWEAPSPRMRLSLAVGSVDGSEPVFQASAELVVPVEIRQWAPPRLARTAQAQLSLLVARWAQALGERLACLPVKAQVLQAQADRVQIDQGSLAGLRAGQEWLLSDRQRVPQRLLEPGAASGLVLARVERVEGQRAELKVLAGPGERVRPQWQAWPMQSP